MVDKIYNGISAGWNVFQSADYLIENIVNASTQQAVLRNGGCNAAESSVQTCNVSTRFNICVPRHRAKPPPRWLQVRETQKVVRETHRQNNET